MTMSSSTSTGTAPGGENFAIAARLSNRWGTRMSTTISSKGTPASRSANQARSAQLEALRVPL